MIDPENKIYLQNIANKVELYNKARNDTVQYLIKRKIVNKRKVENCIIMSQIWMANQINETLTFQQLMIQLGADEEGSSEEFHLEESLKGKTLTQILDIVVSLDGPIIVGDNKK
jgi:hypothetical protein